MDALPKEGAVYERTHRFQQVAFDRFARLSGDDNPIHVDPDFAAQMRFGKPVAHGMLLYGMICGLLSHYFTGAVQISQQMMYPAPTYADEEITIRAEVTAVEVGPARVTVSTVIRGEDGRITCDGKTVLTFPSLVSRGRGLI